MSGKLLFWDTEFTMSTVRGYGTKWDYQVREIVEHQKLMCYQYAWDDGKVHFVSWHDFRTYKQFLKSLSDLLDEANDTVAHNGVGFDNPMVNTQFAMHGIKLPSPYRTIDTLLHARRIWKFPSNSLNDLGEFLHLGSKEKVTYAHLQDEFMTRGASTRCKNAMKRYGVQDVELLRQIYYVERPQIKNHPNLAVVAGDKDACPKCLGHNVHVKKYWYTNAQKYVQYYCDDCKSYPSARLAEKTEKTLLVNR